MASRAVSGTLDRLVPALRAAAERLAPVRRVPMLAYGAYTLVLFLGFLLATFPHELALRRALAGAAAGPVAIEVRDVRLGWMLAYRIGEVALLRRDDPATPLLVAREVRAAPSLLGLLRGRPYPIAIRADVYGGALAGRIDRRPPGLEVDAELRDLDLERHPGLRGLVDGSLRGRLSGTLALQADVLRPASASGSVELRGAGVALESAQVRGITVPDLHFRDVRLAARMRNGRLDVSELAADGDEVSVRGDGTVVLQSPVAASILGLELRLAPEAGAPEGLRLALNLIPGVPGEGGTRSVRIGGSLAQPLLR